MVNVVNEELWKDRELRKRELVLENIILAVLMSRARQDHIPIITTNIDPFTADVTLWPASEIYGLFKP
ncbi:hypothetical protein B841_03875 [Corynebacterium maris DSM 45190]|uniref:Uncharacterized protein n=1 Tax=Corynebacterium maris DSM 45190 TaxID=1224163 RepID=S5THS3_9CORY|nr:hypothetical protein B841_03875 [Corynebacterium maris DSM 45190]